MPSLLVDTTEKAFDAQKRALHARLAQAIGMMSTLSGYGEYTADSKDADGNEVKGKDDAAETFLYEGLSKVYKMNNICDSDNLDKCGIPSTITKMSGESMDFPKKLSELNKRLINRYWGKDSDKSTTDTKVAAFETINGESIAVFYNPNCKNDSEATRFFTQNRMCVNFVYDLNGLKGPNKVGRDIGFITALYAKNPEVVAPIPTDSDLKGGFYCEDAVSACADYSDDTRLPNKNEASSLFYNMELIGNILNESNYWTSTPVSKGRNWIQNFWDGARENSDSLSDSDTKRYARCIKK